MKKLLSVVLTLSLCLTLFTACAPAQQMPEPDVSQGASEPAEPSGQKPEPSSGASEKEDETSTLAGKSLTDIGLDVSLPDDIRLKDINFAGSPYDENYNNIILTNNVYSESAGNIAIPMRDVELTIDEMNVMTVEGFKWNNGTAQSHKYAISSMPKKDGANIKTYAEIVPYIIYEDESRLVVDVSELIGADYKAEMKEYIKKYDNGFKRRTKLAHGGYVYDYSWLPDAFDLVIKNKDKLVVSADSFVRTDRQYLCFPFKKDVPEADIISEIMPFELGVSLPQFFRAVDSVDGAELPPPGVFLNYKYIYNGTKIVGYIGFNKLEPNRDMFYRQNTSTFGWQPYATVKNTENGKACLAKVWYKNPEQMKDGKTKPDKAENLETLGILACDNSLGVYVGIVFNPDVINRATAEKIAQSIDFNDLTPPDVTYINNDYLQKNFKLNKTDVTYAKCDYYTSIALLKNGGMAIWGDNQRGAIGNATSDSSNYLMYNTPYLHKFSSPIIAAGAHDITYALTASGELYVWGSNRSNWLNLNYLKPEYERTYNCYRLSYPSKLAFDKKITAVADSWEFILLLDENGDVYHCGTKAEMYDSSFYLKKGTIPEATQQGFRKLPLDFKCRQIAASSTAYVFLSTGGNVYIQGVLENQEQGIEGDLAFHVPTKIAFTEPIVDVAVNETAVIALTQSGKVYLYGLEDKALISKQTDTTVGENTYLKKFEKPVKAVEAAESYAAAIDADGGLWLWGYDGYGLITKASMNDDVGEFRTHPTPTPVKMDVEPIKSVYLGTLTASAVTQKGEAFMWGFNNQGQQGILQKQIAK